MKTAIPKGVCTLALVYAALGVPAQAQTGNATLIRHVSVFDGESVLNDTSVLITNGKVEGIGPSLNAASGSTVVEGKGCTLLPGLIDSHTHIRSRQDLEQSLALGVTSDISLLMDLNLFRTMKQEQQANRANDRADLFSSGYAATAPGGHGTEKGLSVPTITDPKEAQTWVDNRIVEGSEFIKIIYENGGDTGQGGRPSIDRAALQALIVAAHARGKIAVVHIHSERQAVDAIEANADGLAHLFSHGSDILDPQFAGTVAAHHTFVIPTLSVLESVCNQSPGLRVLNDAKLGPYILPAYVKQLQGNINHGREGKCMIAIDAIVPLAAAHVPILAGTDAGNPGTAPGASLHGELEYLVEAGLTPLQALASATSANAAAFRLSDRGRIAPGLQADLVLVNGNPADDIRATRDIEEIWKAGIPLDRLQWVNRTQQNGATASQVGSWRLPFQATAVLLALSESAGAVVAFMKARRRQRIIESRLVDGIADAMEHPALFYSNGESQTEGVRRNRCLCDGDQGETFPSKMKVWVNGAVAGICSSNSGFVLDPAQVTLPGSAFHNLIFRIADKSGAIRKEHASPCNSERSLDLVKDSVHNLGPCLVKVVDDE